MSKLVNRFTQGLISSLLACSSLAAHAAVEENLRHQPFLAISGLMAPQAGLQQPAIQLEERQRQTDSQQNLHLRLQETYLGYPVWGADVAVHLPAGSMNGVIFKELDKDLANTPAYVFTPERAGLALAKAQILAQQDQQHPEISNQQTRLLVYIDAAKKAHWAYWVQFTQTPAKGMPARPNYLLDALSFEVYRHWDNLQTDGLQTASAGGYGGNPKIGKIIYDGLAGNYPALSIWRENSTASCYLNNTDVVIKDVRKNQMIEKFPCKTGDTKHNGVYWHGSLDSTNGAYSPAMDALYIGKVIKEMYQNWYGIPVLQHYGRPMKLIMRVHWNEENAYWDGEQMTFGDGGSEMYPLVSLGIGAHEISHGFTEQNSNLVYENQSGGLNESFSDMAAQAAEYYSTGKSTWLIGAEVVKAEGQALRYMEHPAADCATRQPGHCSIEHIKDYTDGLNVHLSSGIFNRVFYLLANTPGWDTRKAFDVMVYANRFYWTPTVTFNEAACGVLAASNVLKYPQAAVANAFKEVGLDTTIC